MLYNSEKYQDIGDDPVVCRNSSNLEFKQDLQSNLKWSILENRDGTSLSSDRKPELELRLLQAWAKISLRIEKWLGMAA